MLRHERRAIAPQHTQYTLIQNPSFPIDDFVHAVTMSCTTAQADDQGVKRQEPRSLKDAVLAVESAIPTARACIGTNAKKLLHLIDEHLKIAEKLTSREKSLQKELEQCDAYIEIPDGDGSALSTSMLRAAARRRVEFDKELTRTCFHVDEYRQTRDTIMASIKEGLSDADEKLQALRDASTRLRALVPVAPAGVDASAVEVGAAEGADMQAAIAEMTELSKWKAKPAPRSGGGGAAE